MVKEWKKVMIEELTEKYQNFFEGRTNYSKEDIAKMVKEKVDQLEED